MTLLLNSHSDNLPALYTHSASIEVSKYLRKGHWYCNKIVYHKIGTVPKPLPEPPGPCGVVEPRGPAGP